MLQLLQKFSLENAATSILILVPALTKLLPSPVKSHINEIELDIHNPRPPEPQPPPNDLTTEAEAVPDPQPLLHGSTSREEPEKHLPTCN